MAHDDDIPQVDFEEHEKTHRTFVRGTKYVAFAVPLLLGFIFYWMRQREPRLACFAAASHLASRHGI